METRESIGLITRFLDALNAADTDVALGCLHEDVVLDVSEARQFGHAAFRFHLGRRAQQADEQLGDIVVMVNRDGTRAAAEFTRRGTMRMAGKMGNTGDRYSVSAGMFFAIEDGLIIRITPCNWSE